MSPPSSDRSGIAVAVLMLHPGCNTTCSFCVSELGFESMEEREASELLDRLAARGIRSIVLGGGEPFAWPGDVVALAGAAQARGMQVQIGTNGIALPAGFERLACIDRWVLPLESADARVHDAMRLLPGGHHGLVIDRLATLGAARKSVTLSTVVTAANREGIPALAEFLRDYHGTGQNVHAWHLYQFLPLGRGGRRNREQLAIPADDYRGICRAVKQLELPFRVFQRTDMYRSRTVEFFWREAGEVVSR